MRTLLFCIVSAITINEQGCIEGELAHMKQHGRFDDSKRNEVQKEQPTVVRKYRVENPPYPAHFE